MQDKILKLFFSTRLMGMLFVAFAVAMGIGTFLEDAYGTQAARIWIYNTWWFEAIMLFFLVNFLGNIVRFRLYKKEKWATLLAHLSFILILLGAAITRYIGYEGVMTIREGKSSSRILSEKTYLSLWVDGKDKDGNPLRRTLEFPLELSEATANNFDIKTNFKKQPIQISYRNYIEGAEKTLVPNKDGALYLKFVSTVKGKREDYFIKDQTVANINNVLIAFNKFTNGAININTQKTDNFTIQTPFDGSYLRMADQHNGVVLKDSLQTLQLRSLYQLAGMQFVIPEPPTKGVYQVVNLPKKEKGQENALSILLQANNKTKEITLLGGKGFDNPMQTHSLGDLDFHLKFGSRAIELPFSLQLDDFIATRYPGTTDVYKSYKSKVTILDNQDKKPFEIYMNHVLDYKGYRFFQSSFDPDEKGTILSVNHDYWGTMITYLGYMLLYVSLLLILFTKGSRFKQLEKQLNKLKQNRAIGIVFFTFALFLLSTTHGVLSAQEIEITSPTLANASKDNASTNTLQPVNIVVPDSLLLATKVSRSHARNFGAVVIQDDRGRMKPINTFSSELVRKLYGKDTYKGMNADQVFLSIFQNPLLWYNVPIIKLKRENDSIRKIIGVEKKTKYVSLIDLFDKEGNYKLQPFLQQASSTNTPSNFEKDFLKTHDKFYILNKALTGGIFKVFPVPDHQNNKWISPLELPDTKLAKQDSLFVRHLPPLYRMTLQRALQTKDYNKADEVLESLQIFQKRYGQQVIPSPQKIKAELLLNKYNVFKTLYRYYLLAGLLLMVFLIIQIFRDKSKLVKWSTYFFVALCILLFVVHTVGLITRWYVSGHAPWSDAYESMIYVAWMTIALGLAFGRKSQLTIAATVFVASIILFFAHQNWTDPAIANLQPVLDSYWVLIHVSVIVGSYGPFFVSAILGILSLLLMCFINTKNKKRLQHKIKELTIVNEMAMTIGLVMLTIGNFLGGMWANESWGRYWGWDPKETWALISIMVYAFVIHMRLIPGLKSRWWFNFCSVLAIYSVLMTYFGVNFYLKGLHSYASGDKVITPNSVYYSVASIFVLAFIAYFRSKKVVKKMS